MLERLAVGQTKLEQKLSRSQKSHKIPHNSRRLPSNELNFSLCLSECHALHAWIYSCIMMFARKIRFNNVWQNRASHFREPELWRISGAVWQASGQPYPKGSETLPVRDTRISVALKFPLLWMHLKHELSVTHDYLIWMLKMFESS